jgi:hypothetical protein
MVINLGERFLLSCEDLSNLDISDNLKSQLLDFQSRLAVLMESFKLLKENEYEISSSFGFTYPIASVLECANLISDLSKDNKNEPILNELFDSSKQGFELNTQTNLVNLTADFSIFTKESPATQRVSNTMLIDLTYGFLRENSDISFEQFLINVSNLSEQLIINKICINDLKPRENFLQLIKDDIYQQISKPKSEFRFRFNLTVDQLLNFQSSEFSTQLNILKQNSKTLFDQTFTPASLAMLAYGITPLKDIDTTRKDLLEDRSFLHFIQRLASKYLPVLR